MAVTVVLRSSNGRAGNRGSNPLRRFRERKLPSGGCLVVSHEEAFSVAAPRVSVVDKTGAGDAFAGALGVAMLEGKPLREAARFAVAAATFAVTRYGAQPSYTGGRPLTPVAGKTAILVDDGIATGLTMRAAIEELRRQKPARLVVAVPVVPADTAASLAREVDDVAAVDIPQRYRGAVGAYYGDFHQVTDEEVKDLLQRAESSGASAQMPLTGEVTVQITIDGAVLTGDLGLVEGARGIVLFAHGSGSSRSSPRNRFVAHELQRADIATLLFDLLTEAEDALYRNRFDIARLRERLLSATDWVKQQPALARLPLGYFGASTGAAAALETAAARTDVRTVVSRGGRPDLACRAYGRRRFWSSAATMSRCSRSIARRTLRSERRKRICKSCPARPICSRSQALSSASRT